MLNLLQRKRDEHVYSCYYMTLHFPSPEEAARYFNEHPEIASMRPRLMRGGETLPMCRE